MRLFRRLPGYVLLMPLAVLASCGGGSSSGSALGTVTVLGAPCSGGLGNLPNTTCQKLRVEGLGNAPIEVELRISEPAGVQPVGTVVFGSGSGGTEFYADLPGGELLLLDVLAAGFRVVDRRWVTPWWEPADAVKQEAGRYATLLTWVHANVHTPGFFCAAGGSGGASEIAYALTAWSREKILDVALIASGPPASRLDWFCEQPPSPEWAALCGSIVPAGVMECGQPSCVIGSEITFCQLLPPDPPPGELEAQSILHPGADLDFPDTIVHGLFGAADCTSAVPLGLAFFDSLVSPATVDFVPGAPHSLQSAQSGRDALLGALLGATVGAPPASATAGAGLRIRARRAVFTVDPQADVDPELVFEQAFALEPRTAGESRR